MSGEGQRIALCWGSVEGGSLFDLAEAARAAEIDAISITPRQYLDQAAAGVSDAEMRRRLGDLGVAVTSVDPLIAPMPGVPAPDQVDPGMRWLFEASQEECWRAVEALGAGQINLTQFLGVPVQEERTAEAMARLSAGNRAHGAATTIEFIPGTGVPDLPTADRLTRDVPDLSILFDCWHYARGGGTLDQIAALSPRAIAAVQINDWVPTEPGAPYVPMSGRLNPGEGSLPLARIMALIEANSPGLHVGIEVFNAGLRAMGHGAAVRMLKACTQPLLAGPG